MTRGRVLDVVGTFARLGLAAVWLTSGLLKVVDPAQTYVAVRAYDVLPREAVAVVAGVLPWFELALGVLLLLGIGTRVVACLSAALLLVFIAGVSQAWARGLNIDCGCFGGGGAVAPGQTQYVQEILRDTGFLLLAAWLIVRPRTLLAVENRLAGPLVTSGSGGERN
ncbi:DoxX family membrane protein [Pseudonocardia sp. RS11V-5]|uniref:MauE/DoxX family redox-associated membrane protein n=1 Tax=Pseudonocardia terrae TaxID=2905831 RepID=UPI001E3349B7|nr:MauE/DoxX family redox-associated membrane protein [Pseudonocardia terrae]MCE3550786.1 DoxX family membrane protein [Pseudonocardia terrae]